MGPTSNYTWQGRAPLFMRKGQGTQGFLIFTESLVCFLSHAFVLILDWDTGFSFSNLQEELHLTLSCPGTLARGKRGLPVGCHLPAFRQVSLDSSLTLSLSPAGFFLALLHWHYSGLFAWPQKPGIMFDWTGSCAHLRQNRAYGRTGGAPGIHAEVDSQLPFYLYF